ncbi:MAG TPA: hypothetical protein VNJ12_13510 [Candidatus Dormibacteraeota bacterium]|nr:hypothetical protein [Candidatus Dormibacteraeota bacterium]
MDKPAKLLAIGVILAAAMMSACGGSGAGTLSGIGPSGTMVVMGTDAPTLANVVSFEVPISGITVSGNGKTGVPIVDTPATIDFSRLVGMQALIDIQPLAPGTYTSATITFGGNPTLSVLDTSSTPPAVTSINAVFSTMSTTVNFSQPLNVGSSQALGLMLDFRIGKSIPIDSSGNIVTSGTPPTVTVTPDIQLNILSPQQAKFEIDDLRGGVQKINSDGSFVLQGPGGRQFTVSTDSSTEWAPAGQSFATLSTSDIVNVEEGIVDPAARTVKAGEIDVFPDKFVLTGLVTYVSQSPSSGSICAPTVDLLVRSALPGTTGSSYTEGQIGQVVLNGSENYWVGHKDWLGSQFNLGFGSCTLVPGQALTIGGTLDSSGNLTPKRVVLTIQGFSGTAQSGVAGDNTFQFSPQGLAGVLLPSPVTVQLIELPLFSTELEDLSGTNGIATGVKLHVAGLVLYNTTTNTTNILAGRVVAPTE